MEYPSIMSAITEAVFFLHKGKVIKEMMTSEFDADNALTFARGVWGAASKAEHETPEFEGS